MKVQKHVKVQVVKTVDRVVEVPQVQEVVRYEDVPVTQEVQKVGSPCLSESTSFQGKAARVPPYLTSGVQTFHLAVSVTGSGACLRRSCSAPWSRR